MDINCCQKLINGRFVGKQRFALPTYLPTYLPTPIVKRRAFKGTLTKGMDKVGRYAEWR